MHMIAGSCLCGGVKYRINGTLTHARNCHCSMCRKAHGAAFRSRASAKASGFEWLQGESLVTFYESSPGNYRGFCRVCGSPVVTKFDHASYYGVPLGTASPASRRSCMFMSPARRRGSRLRITFRSSRLAPNKSPESKGPAMSQNITRGIKALMDEANAQIETMSAAQSMEAAKSSDVVIVDIRDPREIERDGRIPGAFSCTRGMLEFWIDPASPYAKPVFQEDKKFIFHCAGGMRSALAAKTAQDMGLNPVAHMAGGFAAWRDAGGPVEKYEPKKPKG